MVCRTLFEPKRPPFAAPGGADGNQVFPVMAVASDAELGQGVFGGFPRRFRRFVLGMSAYAYQEAVSLVLAIRSRTTALSTARTTRVGAGPGRWAALSTCPRIKAPLIGISRFWQNRCGVAITIWAIWWHLLPYRQGRYAPRGGVCSIRDCRVRGCSGDTVGARNVSRLRLAEQETGLTVPVFTGGRPTGGSGGRCRPRCPSPQW